MPLLTWSQYIRHNGMFRCQASTSQAGAKTVQFVVGNQVEAEFDGLTDPQLQQLVAAINAHLNPPASGAGPAPAAAGS